MKNQYRKQNFKFMPHLRSAGMIYFISFSAAGMLFTGCSEENNEGSFNPEDLPLLSMQQSVQFSESDDLLLSSISQLRVDSEGNIILVDGQQRIVHAVDADGNYLQQVGANGSGPGEYQFPGNVSMGDDDALHLINWATRAIITYQKDNGEWVFSSDFIADQEKAGFFSTFFPHSTGDYYVPSGTISVNSEDDSVILKRIDNQSNVVRDSILVIPGNERFTIRNGDTAMMSITQSVMHRQALYTHNYNGTIYYGWSDSLAIYKLTPDSESFVLHADLDLPNSPFTASDADTILSRFETLFEGNPSAREDLVSSFPDTKPVYSQILADESGYLWIDLEQSGDSNTWLILDSNGEPVFRAVMEDGFNLHAVRNGKAYVVSRSDMDVPTITSYSFEY
jgi:hypothetical protein